MRDLDYLLRSMQPVLNEGVYVFASVAPDTDLRAVPTLATFREAEGLTVIAREADAARAGWPALFRAAWITLSVDSDLHVVGLTAAFSAALSEAGISCNVVAAVHHDHIFVPIERANHAMGVLHALQAQAKKS